MTKATPPDLIAVRIETAAQMLDAAPSTVLLWIKNGQLPAHKIGRSWYVRIEEIRKLVSAESVAE